MSKNSTYLHRSAREKTNEVTLCIICKGDIRCHYRFDDPCDHCNTEQSKTGVKSYLCDVCTKKPKLYATCTICLRNEKK